MAYRLCRRDIRAEYSQSALGIFWDIIDPLILGTVFYFLRRGNVFNPGEISMPYPIFVIYGLMLYQTFSDAVLLSLNMMKRFKNLLTHLQLPPEALILATFLRIVFNSSFRILAMLAFSLVLMGSAAEQGLNAFSALGFIKFLLLFPIIILAGMAIGVFLAPFNAVYADIGRLVRITLTPLRYATPVLYMIPSIFPFDKLYAVNPIAIILTNLREVATNNVILNPGVLAAQTAAYAVVFVIGWFIFHVSIPVLAERA